MPVPVSICQVCAVGFTYRKFLEPLCLALAEAGYRVHVAHSGATAADASPRAQALGLQFHPVPIARSSSTLALLRATAALLRLFRRERFTVVHVHTPVAAIAARLAAAMAGTPLVVYTAHGFYFHERMPRLQRWLHIGSEWLLARLTDLLLTQSAEDAELARRLGFKRADRIQAIGNGVQASRFCPASRDRRLAARARFGLRPDALVIGVVARQVAEKGYLELFEAFAPLAAAEPRLQLLICGSRLASDHAETIDPQLQALMAHCPDQVRLAGNVEQVELAYDAMDVFCLPSWREGMPRTIIEAMMSGLPVVATDIRGSREEVVDGLTGLLVPVRDPVALAAALQTLIADAPLRQAYGAAGRQRALRLYDEQQVIALQLALLQQALGRIRR
ncbi:MAG: glycosyltransferase [Cyanobacteriota bacterium]|nr:glycosyltransferase [Cyanobacteriota bacterium]